VGQSTLRLKAGSKAAYSLAHVPSVVDRPGEMNSSYSPLLCYLMPYLLRTPEIQLILDVRTSLCQQKAVRSQNGLGWKGHLRSSGSKPPAIGRDASL